MRKVLVVFIVAAMVASTAAAQTSVCDALTPSQRTLAAEILATEHPYDCCDDTIERCLAARPPCALAVRLANDVCRRVAAGQDETRIRRALSRRARSMVGGRVGTFDLTSAPSAGAANAPVTLVVYACARCPYCSKLVPQLHQELQGRLRGIARIVLRTFPIRGHEGSTEAGLAFTAAARMGRFWEYALVAYRRFDQFSPAALRSWAGEAGLDAALFETRRADPETREALVESKKEGILNGVTETPTLFINGRRWSGDLTVDEIVDAVEEEAERIRGERWSKR